jgi:15-cis-phytoene synthase
VTALALAVRGPADIARATIARHSRSFALASRLLGRRVRDHTAIVYAWCRRADDAIDEPSAASPAALSTALAGLARDLDAIYGATARDPVLAAFGDLVRERAIPRSYPDALLAGLAMDAAAARYITVDDVIRYAWCVAGVVGTMMSHVFGIADDDALVHAAHLGIAMQLTNICRDVAEDWQRGRLYLPDDLLAAHGAPGLAGELGRELPRTAHAAIARTRADLLALADRYYRSGDRGIPHLPARAAFAVAAARRVYAAIGRRIARTGHDVTAGRAVVPRYTRLALAGAAAAATVGRRALALPARIHGSRAVRVPQRILELDDVARL